MPTPREVVADIRRRYRADEPTSDDDPYREMAGGLLPLVADELYESRTHFFQELLQNADDNSYGPGVVPTLVLTARPGALELRNNETGFEEEHVRALCNAAKSTKRDRKDAATGEKGIGFKAVFQISDRPEVHSNGYHFRFDRGKHGDFGIVIPEWIDGAADFPGTTILLPLPTGFRLPTDFLRSLQPEWLLFLRRLKRIEFHDPDYGQSLVLHRNDEGPAVEVVRTVTHDFEWARSGQTRHRFRLHRKRVSTDDIQEPRRPNIADSEVAVALLLDSDGSVDERREHDLYAFLPVKRSGFRFLAHADFVVATSREALREDLPWNWRLREALAACLSEAVLECRSAPLPGATALRVIKDPETAADEFLGGVLAKAIKALSKEECVPTIDGGWACPADTIMTDREGVWQLVPQEAAAELLGLRFVTPGVDRIEQALSCLKVRRFSLDSLLDCVSNDGWRGTRAPEWFGELYASLGALRLDDGERRKLKRAPVVLLESSRTVAAAATLVFRSLGGESRYGFEHEISLLATSALASLSADRMKQAHDLLQQLGVTDATPTAVIERHIVSAHQGDDWEDCADETLIGHAHYLRDNLEAYLNAKAPDKRAGALLTISQRFTVLSTASAEESRYATGSSLFLGSAYGDPSDLEGLFGADISERVVSPAYLERGHSEGAEAARRAWAELFKQLGAMTLPPVYIADRTDYQWGDETARLIMSADLDRTTQLLALIDRHWDLRFAQWNTRRGRADQPSAMLLALRTMQVRTSSGAAPLGGAYADSDGNRSVFGDAVPYLLHPLKSSGLADALGVTTVPTVMHAIRRLRKIRESKLALALSKPMVASLLRFLESRWGQQSAEIKAELAADSLVPVDGADGSVWVATGSCCWTLPREVSSFSRLSGLSATWRDFKGFFCEKLGVPEGPAPESLVDALEAMSEAEIPHEQSTRASRAVYARLRQAAAEVGGVRSAAWVQQLRQGLLIWTHHHQWWRNDGDVFAADDPSIEKLFASAPDVAFVNLPREELTGHRDLLRLLDVPWLSDAIETSVPDNVRDAEWGDFQQRLAERLRAIARFLHHKHPTVFMEAAAESGAFHALKTLDVRRCSPLQLDVSLGELRAQHAFDARMIRGGTQWCLYMDSSVEGYDSAAVEIGRLLGLTDTESIPIGILLEKRTLGEAERFLEKTLSVPDLPAEVARALFGDRGGEPEDASEDYSDDDPLAGSDNWVVAENAPAPASTAKPAAGDHPTGHVAGAAVGPSVGDAGSGQADGEGAATGGPGPGVAPRNGPSMEAGRERSPGATTRTENERADGPKDHGSWAERDGATANVGGRSNAAETDLDGLEVEDEGADRPPGSMEGQPGRPGGPPTRPDAAGRDRSSRPPTDRPSEQLRSRVVPEPEAGDDDDSERSSDIARIAAAAMRHALAWESQQGRRPTDENVLNPHHQGHDITSLSPGSEVVRYIEVKGVAGAWGFRGVEVTPRQFEFSLAHGELSWLYVVEHALGDAPVIHRVQDFARRVWRYGFDCGWQEVGEETGPAWPEPTVGARVRLASGETGLVSRVFGAGVNRGVEVTLEKDGSTQRVIWQPSRVTPLGAAEGL